MERKPIAPLDAPAIDQVWIDAAARCGFRVERGQAAYATTDGQGTISIGTPDLLDDDDCLAQLVLHELCHALVQGEANWSQPDWGMDNTTDRDDNAEAACLRLQAHWSARRGLRQLMTPTTPWKTYYAGLPGEPLFPADARDQSACDLAAAAVTLAARKGMDVVIDQALAATAGMAEAAGVVVARSEGSTVPVASPGLHPVGFALAPARADQTCGTCSWIYRGGRGPAVERCRQSTGEVGDGRRTRAEFPACVRWEPPVDCLECGACCREAYHSVSVSLRDPVVWKQPGLVVRDGHRFSLLRAGPRCAALESEESAQEIPAEAAAEPAAQLTPALAPAARAHRYHCRIYDDRPRTCREFEQGGRHCLTARRRVGLSPAG
jgi:Fe-S-cluster containining protein